MAFLTPLKYAVKVSRNGKEPHSGGYRAGMKLYTMPRETGALVLLADVGHEKENKTGINPLQSIFCVLWFEYIFAIYIHRRAACLADFSSGWV